MRDPENYPPFFVSVVIPVYNGEKYLAQAIESAFHQGYLRMEIIVADDGSTDRTAEIARSFGDRVRYVYQSNQGVGQARNLGIRTACGDLIAFLDADDIWSEDKLKTQTAVFEADPTVDIVLGQIQIQRLAGKEGEREIYRDIAYPFIGFYAHSGLFRKTLFDRLGPFEAEREPSEDFDWMIRALEQKVSIVTVPRVGVYYRLHGDNSSRQNPAEQFIYLKKLKYSLDRRRRPNSAVDALPSFRVTENPLVSVIMPVQNGEAYLEQAIQSVIDQNYEPYEILVVDSHSTDRTRQIAETFGRVRTIVQENYGFPDALNTGIRASRGQVLAFLDHDDLWAPGKLKLQVDYLKGHSETQYVVGKIKFFLEPGSSVPAGFRKELLEGEREGYLTGTLAARRDLFKSVGFFNTELSIATDVDWFARAKDENVPMAVLPEVLLHKRVHDRNLSSNVTANNNQLLNLLRHSVARQSHAR